MYAEQCMTFMNLDGKLFVNNDNVQTTLRSGGERITRSRTYSESCYDNSVAVHILNERKLRLLTVQLQLVRNNQKNCPWNGILTDGINLWEVFLEVIKSMIFGTSIIKGEQARLRTIKWFWSLLICQDEDDDQKMLLGSSWDFGKYCCNNRID